MVLPRKAPKTRLRNLFQLMIEDTKKGQRNGLAHLLHRLCKRMRVQLFTLLIMIGCLFVDPAP
jgi:hypothetical protein